MLAYNFVYAWFHQTAGGFLLRLGIESKFGVEKKLSHKRLALTCLQFVCSNEMKNPRQSNLCVKNIAKLHSAFIDCAYNALHEAIHYIFSTDDDVSPTLMLFLNSLNLLAWSEHLARGSDLSWDRKITAKISPATIKNRVCYRKRFCHSKFLGDRSGLLGRKVRNVIVGFSLRYTSSCSTVLSIPKCVQEAIRHLSTRYHGAWVIYLVLGRSPVNHRPPEQTNDCWDKLRQMLCCWAI